MTLQYVKPKTPGAHTSLATLWLIFCDGNAVARGFEARGNYSKERHEQLGARYWSSSSSFQTCAAFMA